MQNEHVFKFDIGAEINRYFDDSSLPDGAESRIVIFMGGVASGKTTLRKQRYSTGFVLVDAADIFLNLSRGGFFPFPEAFEEPMQIIGSILAQRAVAERRNIVTELIGAELDPAKDLIEAMLAIDYKVDLQAITCDVEEAQRRNLNRGDDCISAYYAEPYQRAWLMDAAVGAQKGRTL
jgi:hypothetical protein